MGARASAGSGGSFAADTFHDAASFLSHDGGLWAEPPQLTNAHDVPPAASEEELRRAFAGGKAGVGTAGSGEELAAAEDGQAGAAPLRDYDWCLCLVLPHESEAARSRRMPLEDAVDIFTSCFHGEEVVVAGTALQQHRHQIECRAFRQAAEALCHEDGTLPRADFLRLMRNALITKLTLHCALTVKAISSSDRKRVFLMVTCDEGDLRREAERQGIPCELDLLRTDAESLEPCGGDFRPLFWHLVPRHERVRTAFEEVVRVAEAEQRRAVAASFGRAASRTMEPGDSFAHVRDAAQRLTAQMRGLAAMEGQEADAANFRRGLLQPSHSARAACCGALRGVPGEEVLADAYAEYLRLKARGLQSKDGTLRDPRRRLILANQAFTKSSGSRHRPGPLLDTWQQLGFADPLAAHCPYSSSLPSDVWRQSIHCALPQAEAEGCANAGIRSPFSEVQRLKLAHSIISRQVDLPAITLHEAMEAWFPLDSRRKADNCRSLRAALLPGRCGLIALLRWTTRSIDGEPLEQLRDYYGEKVGIYFAFLEVYANWLRVPAFIGLAVFLFEEILPSRLAPSVANEVVQLAFAVVLNLWGTFLPEGWKRRRELLVLKWGMSGQAAQELPRPQFVGVLRQSPVTGQEELYYSETRRFWKQIAGWLVLLAILATAGECVVLNSRLRNEWKSDWAASVSGVLNSVQIKVFNFIGVSMAIRLNRWENYRTQTAFTNALVLKTFAFTFCNSFYAFFYIAFVKGHTEDKCVNDDCLEELRGQLRVVFLLSAAMNAVELGLPLLTTHWRRRRLNLSTLEPRAPLEHIVERQLQAEPYGSLDTDGTFDEYAEVAVQFGFVMLFAVAFPLGPVAGLILTLLEVKTDGIKMLRVVRRPQPESAEDIGSWYVVLQAISTIAVFTNAALLVWTFRCADKLPQLSEHPQDNHKLYFGLLCAALLVVKRTIAVIVPDVSRGVMLARLRLQKVADGIRSTDARLPKEDMTLSGVPLSVEEPGTNLRSPSDFGLLVRGEGGGQVAAPVSGEALELQPRGSGAGLSV